MFKIVEKRKMLAVKIRPQLFAGLSFYSVFLETNIVDVSSILKSCSLVTKQKPKIEKLPKEVTIYVEMNN